MLITEMSPGYYAFDVLSVLRATINRKSRPSPLSHIIECEYKGPCLADRPANWEFKTCVSVRLGTCAFPSHAKDSSQYTAGIVQYKSRLTAASFQSSSV